MSFTKPIVNAIYRALLPHDATVKQVQALFLWNRPLYSCIFFAFVEGLFVLAYFLPFSWSCNLCLIVGSFILSYCLYGAFPMVFDKLLAFEIKEVPPTASNRIRSTPEISAFLTTAISFWTKFVENIFNTATDATLYNAIFSMLSLLAFFIVTFFIGDFWLIWIIFHSIFVVPSILVLPGVQHWLTEQDSGKSETHNEADGDEKSSDGQELPPTESESMMTDSVLEKND
ncbi:hypothetical protein TRFO_12195 [Tritrichomonas foetus]|uniref:RETREG1-3/ARL6IP-like N-terminal reticulon-homology domain-containing protein n=1 Tax=Tritrichomonas foetus TaxID=1144522 RepID=A0A1J4J5W5_9EUKA|nr:hypothetical protein TRFO_12195 [Tritrichomonas foetus]|eukprot:OHS92845.1 hypothetical protein TRFO_12195 [Tritrichomonas foetus]